MRNSRTPLTVFPHPRGVDGHVVENKVALDEGVGGIGEGLWDDHKFEMPRSCGALKVGDERIQGGGNVRPGQTGDGHDDLGRDGIALVWHGTRRSTVGHERFLDLCDLHARHEHDVVGDLSQGSAHRSEEADGLDDVVPGDVDADRRLSEAEPFADGRDCPDPFRQGGFGAHPHASQRARGTADRGQQGARAELSETLRVPVE